MANRSLRADGRISGKGASRALGRASTRARENRTNCLLHERAFGRPIHTRERLGGNAHEDNLLALVPLVRHVALGIRKRLPSYVEIDDLVGEGMLGLLDAVRKFDVRRHTKLETYARYRIRGAILDGLRSIDSVSRDLRKKSRKVEKVRDKLENALGRRAEGEEMAEALGIGLKKWHATANQLPPASADWTRLVHEPKTREFDEQNWPSQNQDTSFDLCYQREQRDILKGLVAALPERERTLLQLYYARDLTMKQIAGVLGIDESRVSQIHSTVVAKLRARVNVRTSTPRPYPQVVSLRVPQVAGDPRFSFLPSLGAGKPTLFDFHPIA